MIAHDADFWMSLITTWPGALVCIMGFLCISNLVRIIISNRQD